MTLLHHGGRLQSAISEFGGGAQDWLDLSTGVSPWHYPIPEIPVACWNRLPEEEDGLIAAADQYYGGHNALPVSGSQAAIQALPSVLAAQRGGPGVVLLPKVGYKEHERAWRKQGWRVEYYASLQSGGYSKDASNCQFNKQTCNAVSPTAEQLQRCDALVVINPNNPTACLISNALLRQWLNLLKSRGAFLVVDEAFMDMTPEQSLVGRCDDNLVILRSIGKFFGLAGIRAGFVFAPAPVRLALQTLLGPWCLNGPARYVCTQALSDSQWQHIQQDRLVLASDRLAKLLSELPGRVVGTGLFQTVYMHAARQWFQLLCHNKVLVRLTDEQDAIRVGLPADEAEWTKLTLVLAQVLREEAQERTQTVNHGVNVVGLGDKE
ncbi:MULTISPECIES: threonine-phosphate decarboxylase CobD [unclassified Shewanella]|uniref:threonine-phosphate decarboxylase CobD n=1 Tax=unclassified Shewanella TaxID=196818 RepID=UPI001BBD4000|nr:MULTISPECIES: threonine-phosphate decarboxylase CobD [unclassified Shewanella]GIU16968.1 threonine-phosphate decarboxylase [Shewanella sp. MBTL60-112-B1]GIU40912.1 threonine-phosphate decarboxylase [Shewanella sp. MBTL60-112-B2]